MSRLVKIEKNLDIKSNKLIKEYLNPNHVYIPYSKKYELDIKMNDNVLLNGLILHNNDDYVYSTVSGKIMGACESIVDGKKMPTIIIENDFREKVYKVKGISNNIDKFTSEEANKLLKIYNAINSNLKGNILLISGIDYEPYEETMSYLISKHADNLLECIDALCSIFKITNCYLAIKNNDSENVEKLINEIGTYPNINLKLMPDLYPIGKKEVLINELNLNKYNKEDIIFLTIEDIYAIYNVLKRRRPITDKLVTFSGDLINKAKVMRVKIGTNIGDIVNEEFKINGDDYHIIINGLISGYEIKNLNAIITSNIRSVFINSKKYEVEEECINCGLCVNHCPVGANPKEKIKMDKCINCGLCNYICPSKIKLVGDKND